MARSPRKKNQFPPPNRREEAVGQKGPTPHGTMQVPAQSTTDKLRDGESIEQKPYKGKGKRRLYKNVRY